MKLKKILFVVLGCISAALGALGAVLPLLPTFPFLLLATFCFARSSERLHSWFTGTRLYKNNLESYVKGQGMTRKTKIKIMVTVTALMTVGFIMMDQVPVGRVVLTCVWVFHLFYFLFGVKTIRPERTMENQSQKEIYAARISIKVAQPDRLCYPFHTTWISVQTLITHNNIHRKPLDYSNQSCVMFPHISCHIFS